MAKPTSNPHTDQLALKYYGARPAREPSPSPRPKPTPKTKTEVKDGAKAKPETYDGIKVKIEKTEANERECRYPYGDCNCSWDELHPSPDPEAVFTSIAAIWKRHPPVFTVNGPPCRRCREP